MKNMLWICFGGAVGTGGRYLLSEWARNAWGGAFPYGTLAVNVVGSLLLAFLMGASAEATPLSSTTRLALTTGLLGGFTTFSTFSYETLGCLQRGAWGVAALNVTLNVLGCIAAGFLGWFCARAIFVH